MKEQPKNNPAMDFDTYLAKLLRDSGYTPGDNPIDCPSSEAIAKPSAPRPWEQTLGPRKGMNRQ